VLLRLRLPRGRGDGSARRVSSFARGRGSTFAKDSRDLTPIGNYQAPANVASGTTQGGRAAGGLATMTAGRTMAGGDFGIAILSSRTFARTIIGRMLQGAS